MADEPQDVKAPAAPQEPATPAPSTEETKPEVAEDKVLETLKSDDDKPSEPKDSKPRSPKSETDKPKEEPDKKPEVVEKPEEPKAEETKEEDKPQTKADERKSQLNTEIRDLVSQRNALKEEVAKANEVYQPATEQELQDDGMSATDAKVEALRQQIEVKDYTEKVAEAQLTIESESNRVLQDFGWSNPESPDFKEELSQEAAQLLQQNLIIDENTNQVIGSNISPYQLYKTLDRARGISTVDGQMKGQQDTEQMLANADTASSAAPPNKPKDPVLDILRSDEY